jgi:Glycine-zipper domain
MVALTRHEKLPPVLCPPERSPSRNEVVGRFLDWAKRNTQHLTEPAVEVVGAVLPRRVPLPAEVTSPGGRMTRIALVVLLTLSLGGGASATDTQRRAATGTVAGAAGGAAIGAMAGNAGMGAAIGAGVGLLGGLPYDQNQRADEQGRRDGQAGR